MIRDTNEANKKNDTPTNIPYSRQMAVKVYIGIYFVFKNKAIESKQKISFFTLKWSVYFVFNLIR